MPFALRTRFSLGPARALAVALGPVSVAWMGPAHAQSLVQLTEQALQHDASYQAQRAAYDASIYRGAQAQSALLPQVALQAGSQYSDTRVVPDAPAPRQRLDARQDQLSVQASQVLYAPAKLYAWRQGQGQVRIAQAQLEQQTQDVMVRTAQAYFDLGLAQEQLHVTEQQLRAVQEQLDFAKRNFEIGAATITDTHEAQSRYDLVQAQHIAAANAQQVKTLVLAQLTGQIEPHVWKLAPQTQSTSPTSPRNATTGSANAAHASSTLPAATEPAPLQPLAHWLHTAAQHPAVIQARKAADIAQLEVAKAQAGHRPTIDMQASYGVQRNPDGSLAQGASMGSRTTAATVGIVAQLPLFAGFAVQNRVKESLALQTQAQAEQDAAERKVHQAVQTAYWNWESSQAQARALQAAVRSSHSALEANQLGYEVGVRINMDVLNAQSQWFEAQKDWAQARYQSLLTYLQLKQAAGVLHLADVEEVSTLLVP